MEALKIFKNPEFGEIRTIEEDGKVLFCGSDVAKALGYSRPQDAISRHCRYSVKRRVPHPQSPNKTIEMTFIPEGDIYRLSAKSELPEAERFESWIFDEVLPSIRKHGAYMTPETLESAILNPDTMIRLCTALKDEQDKRKALENKVYEDAPKVLFANAVSTAKTSILIGEQAKILKQNGINIGQNRLFEWLRKNGYLISRKGSDYNMPTQRSMEQGLMEIKETTVTNPDGSIRVNKTPKITGKGQIYFSNRFIRDVEQ